MIRLLDHLGRKLIACWVGCVLVLIGTLNHRVSEAVYLACCGAISSMTIAYMTTNAIAGKKGTTSTESTEAVVVTRTETKDGTP